MAVVIIAALLLGAAVGRALPPTAAVDATAQSAPYPDSSEPFVYFPSQYVNQGTEIEEHIQQH